MRPSPPFFSCHLVCDSSLESLCLFVSGSKLEGDKEGDDELGPCDLPAVFCCSSKGLQRRMMSKLMSQHYTYPSFVRNTASTSCVKCNHLLALVRHLSAH